MSVKVRHLAWVPMKFAKYQEANRSFIPVDVFCWRVFCDGIPAVWFCLSAQIFAVVFYCRLLYYVVSYSITIWSLPYGPSRKYSYC